MDKLTTITNSGRKNIPPLTTKEENNSLPFFESSRRRPRQEKSTFRVLKSQTTNGGSCSYFLFWKRERSPPPLPRQFSVEGETSNTLTREFNQLNERTHSSTTKRESALGSPLKSPTTNEQIQARDTSEESSELRQQLRKLGK